MLLMDNERCKNTAAGIQSLILALAVVVGGGWALFRFASLEETDRVAAELEPQPGHSNRGKNHTAMDPMIARWSFIVPSLGFNVYGRPHWPSCCTHVGVRPSCDSQAAFLEI